MLDVFCQKKNYFLYVYIVFVYQAYSFLIKKESFEKREKGFEIS